MTQLEEIPPPPTNKCFYLISLIGLVLMYSCQRSNWTTVNCFTWENWCTHVPAHKFLKNAYLISLNVLYLPHFWFNIKIDQFTEELAKGHICSLHNNICSADRGHRHFCLQFSFSYQHKKFHSDCANKNFTITEM